MRFHNFGCFLKQVQKTPKSWEKVQIRSFIRIRKKHSYRLEKPLKLPFFFAPLFQTIMDAFLGRFPIHTGPTPPLTPQTMLDEGIQNFF